MTTRNDAVHVEHIVESIARVLEWTANGPTTVYDDEKTRDAVLRKLQTLTESSMRVSPQVKEQFPDVPWQEMARFRSVVVHDYLGINLEIIWRIIRERLPEIQPLFARILRSLPQK